VVEITAIQVEGCLSLLDNSLTAPQLLVINELQHLKQVLHVAAVDVCAVPGACLG
jgi:hypothetical protein